MYCQKPVVLNLCQGRDGSSQVYVKQSINHKGRLWWLTKKKRDFEDIQLCTGTFQFLVQHFPQTECCICTAAMFTPTYVMVSPSLWGLQLLIRNIFFLVLQLTSYVSTIIQMFEVVLGMTAFFLNLKQVCRKTQRKEKSAVLLIYKNWQAPIQGFQPVKFFHISQFHWARDWIVGAL